MGLILLLLFISEFVGNFPSLSSPFNANSPAWLILLGALVLYGAVIYSQIYRYRRVSTPVQRQQTKWIILGVVAGIVVAIGILAIGPFISSSAASNNLGTAIFFITVWPIAFLLIPLSIGFSIL